MADYTQTKSDIAVIGLSCRFPGSNNVNEFWNNIVNGIESIQKISIAHLHASGVNKNLLSHPNYINACGFLNNIDKFDNAFFKISDLEAAAMDPQHRIFLETAYHALEDAGYSTDKYDGKIGIYAGSGPTEYYYELIRNNYFERHPQSRQLLYYLGNEKDFLALRVAYALNLTGPAMSINLASATGLAVVIKACHSLINDEADIMLAGASSVILPNQFGYIHEPGNIFSADGHCRPFDKDSSGTVLGSGVGVLVLKRLDKAISDNDSIYAILKGYAINNDGNRKIGFTAPSVKGQANCFKEALRIAKIKASQIQYIEAHGTGTHLGDPIEIAALTEEFNFPSSDNSKCCAISSVKANIGHAQSAAGMAGLIKMILSIKNRVIPPSINYQAPNPKINFDKSPFFVNVEPINWNNDTRIGGVNALAMGGINTHIIISNFDAKSRKSSKFKYEYNIIPLSADSELSLANMVKNLKSYLDALPEEQLHDTNLFNSIAYTLQTGRKNLPTKATYICNSLPNLLDLLRDKTPNKSECLDQIKSKWLGDKSINWDELYSIIPQKISLPKYPFLEKSHWLLETKKNVLAREGSITKETTKSKADSFKEAIEKLSNIWSRSLNLKNFNPYDDFISLGGDSLISLEIITEIEKEFGLKLSIDQFMQEGNVVNLLKILVKQDNNFETEAKLKYLNNYSASNQNLFIIHPGNGELYFYDELSKILNNKINMVGIANNVFNDIDKKSEMSINKLAKIYIDLIKTLQPIGPYNLAGWSLGGVVAFEMACQLKSDKSTNAVEKLFLIDSWAQYSKIFNDSNYFFNTYLSANDNSLLLTKTGLWGNLLWKRIQALFDYKPTQIDTQIILLKASSINVEYKDVNAFDNHWQQYCKQPISIVLISGNHETMLKTPGLEEIANNINSAICQPNNLLEENL